MLPEKTEVLIVGAGPTGLALAIALQQAGIDHLLIDRLPQGENTSRAAVIHAHTLEMLQGLGVSGDLLRQGLSVTRFTVRDRDRPLLDLRFDTLPSPYRSLLMIPQDATERVLAARLQALGGVVYRNVTALAIEADGSGARARLRTAGGDALVRARYVVGADGMHSIVREAAGIAFRGSSYAESFVLADATLDWSLGTREVSLFFSPAGMMVAAPLPNGQLRLVAAMEDAPDQPTREDIQRLIDARGPTGHDNRVEQIAWSSRFRIHHRLADRYRTGPLLLMGDAAHVHSPAGGQGMNTGLVDAVVLGRALVAALRDAAPEAVLDRYGTLRRAAAAEVLGLAGRLTTMATMRTLPGRLVRNGLLRLVNGLPMARRRVVAALSGIARRHFTELGMLTAARAAPVADRRRSAPKQAGSYAG